jgi:hypothetical protein
MSSTHADRSLKSMQNRDVIVTDTQTERSAQWGVIAAVIVIALAIALFVWQPWNSTTTQSNSNTTSVTQPANGANNANGQAGGSQTNSNSGTSGGSNSNP